MVAFRDPHRTLRFPECKSVPTRCVKRSLLPNKAVADTVKTKSKHGGELLTLYLGSLIVILNAMILLLPNEMLTEIISFTSVEDHRTLARVSKRFNQVATRLLYRNVHVSGRGAASRFYQLISGENNRATDVIQMRYTVGLGLYR